MTKLDIFLCIIAALFVLAFIVVQIELRSARKSREESDWNYLYGQVMCIIQNPQITETNQRLILKRISDLRKMPYHNREKMEVLMTEFKRRYDKLSKEILSEDEYSLYDVMVKN